MKIALFSLLAIVGLASCKKTYNSTVNQVFAATYKIEATDWTANANSTSQTASLPVSELDAIIQAQGGVQVYISFDNGTTFEGVPETVNGVAYGSFYSVGNVGIDLQAVDGSAVTAPTGEIIAKVVLLDGVQLPN